MRAVDIIGDHWSLLILRDLASGPRRFKDLKENISGISMDQLTKKLESLCKNLVIVRQEFSESPPRVEYQLTESGRKFLPALKRILIWSSENLWGTPTHEENIDFGLTLRVMATFWGVGEGTISLTIKTHQGQRIFVITRYADGKVVNEAPNSEADAKIEMFRHQWIKLISESGRDTKCKVIGKISGSRHILNRVLPLFSRVTFIERENQKSDTGKIEDLTA